MHDNNAKVLLARQAIYDRKLRVFGYELLFRTGDALVDPALEGDKASSDVMLNAFGALPVADILDGKPAFINFTRHLLDQPPPVDRRQLVVEVLESVLIDDSTIDAIRKLKQRGYVIALDDYRYDPDHHALLELADIVKIDVLDTSPGELPELIRQLRGFGVRLLAEKVETHAMFNHCQTLGFDLFQGYFLARPQPMQGRQVNAGQQSVLRLMSVMRAPQVSFQEIEKVILTDSVLSFKLLRLVNSALFNLPRKIESIQQALALLGLDRIRSWSTLLALGSLTDKPAALYMNAMLRARMCQALGEQMQRSRDACERLFTIGLLSTLDLFLDMPMTAVLEAVDLDDELHQAILERGGSDGLLLATATSFEQGLPDSVDWPALAELGLDDSQVGEAYIHSLVWARDNIAQLF